MGVGHTKIGACGVGGWGLSPPILPFGEEDLVTAVKSNYAKKRLNPSHSWKMRFRSRKRNKGLVALNIEALNFKVSKDGNGFLGKAQKFFA